MSRLYFYVDLETNGLPLNGDYSNCNIISVAVIFATCDNKSNIEILTKKSFIIKPGNFIFSEKAIEIHKITRKMAEEFGLCFEEAFGELLPIMENCTDFVAYNTNFDYNVLLNEFKTRKMEKFVKLMESYNVICVMQTAIIKLKLKKYIKLVELYRHICPELPPFKEHDAMEDIYATLQCHKKLKFI